MRSVVLDDEALEDEVMDDDDAVTVDGILVEENLFRVLLLRLGISDESLEFYDTSIPRHQNRRGVDHPPRRSRECHPHGSLGGCDTRLSRVCCQETDPCPDQGPRQTVPKFADRKSVV